MSTRGRKPKPTAVKQLQGNPGKRPINRHEPWPEGKAKKPRGLVPRVAKLWDEMAGPLEGLGLLTDLDAAAFRMMLQHYQFALEAARQVLEEGLTRRDENGVERRHPSLQAWRENSVAFRAYAEQFGMTPSARARLGPAPTGQLALGDILAQAIFEMEE